MPKLPDALEDDTAWEDAEGGMFKSSQARANSKKPGTGTLYAFLGAAAAPEFAKDDMSVELFPRARLPKRERAKKQAQRMSQLCLPRSHTRVQKVKTNGISKGALDWHVHYASQIPGPGQYKIEDVRANITRVFIHSGPAERTLVAKESKDKAHLPGPFDYDAIPKNRVTHGYMGVKTWIKPPKDDDDAAAPASQAVGPAVPDYRPTVRAHSFGSATGALARQPKKKKTNGPGPGQYNTTQRRPQSAGPAFGTGPRSMFDDPRCRQGEATPGPGAYAQPKARKSGGYISTHKGYNAHDRKLREAAKLPGPGSYDIATPSNPPSFVMKRSPSDMSALDWELHYKRKSTPDVGAYPLPRNPLPQGGRWSTSGKPDPAPKHLVDVPGPAHYNPKPTHKVPGGKFGKAEVPRSCLGDSEGAVRELAKQPGPGAYEGASSSTLSGTGGKMAWMTRTIVLEQSEEEAANAPGPGDYNTATQANVKVPKFNRHNSTSRISEQLDEPGPGDYKIDAIAHRVVGGKFAQRMKSDMNAYAMRESAAVPGPGEYDIPSTMEFRGGRVYVRAGPGS